MINKVATIVTQNGEFVGKVTGMTETTVTLSDPRMIVTNDTGMGFAVGIAMTGLANPKTVKFANYIFLTETSQEVTDAWNEQTGQIVLPSVSKIIGS